MSTAMPSIAAAYVRAASVFAVVTAVLVTVGWVLDVPLLKRVVFGFASMKINTAAAILLAGAALWLLRDPDVPRLRRHAGFACAAVVVLIGALTFAQHLFQWNAGIDELLMRDPEGGGAPGRPAPNTAFALALIGAALLTLDVRPRRRYAPSEGFSLGAFFIGLLALIGYAYSASALYKFAPFGSTALHTALALIVLATGTLAARPTRGLMRSVTYDGPSGVLMRRLLPAALLVPFLLGWLRLQGERRGLYENEFAAALVATGNIIVFTTLLFLATRSIRRTDVERRAAQEALARANDELEARIAQRTAELADRNRSLQTEISERQKAEDQLRGMLDAAPDAVVIADADARTVLVSAQTEAMFGYTRAELLGQPAQRLIVPRLRDEYTRHVHGYVADPDYRPRGTIVELYGLRKDGLEFPVGVSFSRVQTRDGVFIFSDIRDITWRKRAQADLAQRSAALEAVNRELEAFSYSVSHDLRAPLRSIDGFSKALLEDYRGVLDDEGRDHLARVRTAAQRMAQLIDDMLKLARVTRAELKRGDVDLSEVVDGIARDLVRAEPERAVEFVIARGVTANCDRNLIGIALSNLVGNAWKFSGARTPARIEFGVAADRGRQAYYIRDNGVGFDMAYADKLFGAFQRLHRADEYPGTGIGLATVQRILHKHGGRVWAQSELEKGATFYFVLFDDQEAECPET